MTDPGLSNRLRQHSRRAGLTVGLSMALTIGICVGGFSLIYAVIAPLLSDVVGSEAEPTPEETRIAAPQGGGQPAEAEEEAPAAPQVAAATAPTAPPNPAPTEAPQPTATEAAFQPDFQIQASQSINLRPEPSTNNAPILALSPSTPLQYLGEEQPANDGTMWRRFRTEDGQEGWIRDIDVVPYQED
jgi:type IV secretory pathway VirB10-like protein